MKKSMYIMAVLFLASLISLHAIAGEKEKHFKVNTINRNMSGLQNPAIIPCWTTSRI